MSVLFCSKKRFRGCFFALIFVWASLSYAADSVVSITLSGTDDDMAETLQQGLSLERHKNNPRLNQAYIERLYQDGFTELKTMLSVFGYYQPLITGDLQPEGENWLVQYQIELGQPVLITAVDIKLAGEAENDPEFSKLIDEFPLKVGQVFDHQQYESAKKRILRLATSRGYFDGTMKHAQVDVDPEQLSAVIHIDYDSGIRYKFEQLVFPSTVVNQAFLEKLVPFTVDTLYSSDDVLKLRNRLTNSGYFESVVVNAEVEQRHDGYVPLSIELEPKAKHLYTAGIGYGTDTGARLALGWENRYINRRGHRLNTDLRLSQISNSLSSDYVMPFWSDTINKVGFNTELKQEETDTSESQSFAVGSYYQRQRWDWDELGSLKLLQEDFDVSDDSESVLLLIPGITWSRTWADDSLYTKQGARLSFELSGASESLLSDITFGQVVISGKYIDSFGDSSRIITRGTVGVTEVSDFERLPSSLRFFAGGDQSIRGFDYEALGPLGSDGNVVGGRYLAVGSVEYENMLWGDWGAAVFTDFGNAFNSFSDPIEYSVGIGIRWRSPVGLIRVDVAKALSQTDEPIALHIVIGPDF